MIEDRSEKSDIMYKLLSVMASADNAHAAVRYSTRTVQYSTRTYLKGY